MDTTLDGKTLAECQGYHIKPVRTANSTNAYKYIVVNPEKNNRDTAILAWLSKSLSEKYNDFEYAGRDCVLRLQRDEDTGEPTHYLLTSASLYKSIDELLASGEW